MLDEEFCEFTVISHPMRHKIIEEAMKKHLGYLAMMFRFIEYFMNPSDRGNCCSTLETSFRQTPTLFFPWHHYHCTTTKRRPEQVEKKRKILMMLHGKQLKR
jgi:hypothetical protein